MVQPFRMLNGFGSGVLANTPSQKTGGPSPRQRSSAVTYSHRFFTAGLQLKMTTTQITQCPRTSSTPAMPIPSVDPLAFFSCQVNFDLVGQTVGARIGGSNFAVLSCPSVEHHTDGLAVHAERDDNICSFLNHQEDSR